MDDVITLLAETVTQDAIGNIVSTYTETEVFCQVLSIDRNEFYRAGQTGLKPKYKFVTNTANYNGEALLVYKAKQYSIYRTYRTPDDEMELYAEERTGVTYGQRKG